MEGWIVVLVLAACTYGIWVLGRSRPPRGAAAGTLGSVFAILDSTGVPTREEAAAAVEEQKQMRLEAYSAGPRGGGDPYAGTVRLGTARSERKAMTTPTANNSAPGGSGINRSGLNTDMSRHPMGKLERLDDGSVRFVFVRDYPHAVERVWTMLTEPAKTSTWWASARGKAETGSEFSLKWLNGGDAELDWWSGEVLHVEPPRLFEHSNSQHGLLRWELEPAVVDGHPRTRLTFTNILKEPGDAPSMNLAGWHVHLDHLHEALDGKPVDWPSWQSDFMPAWQRLQAEYARLYPDATSREDTGQIARRVESAQSDAADTI